MQLGDLHLGYYNIIELLPRPGKSELNTVKYILKNIETDVSKRRSGTLCKVCYRIVTHQETERDTSSYSIDQQLESSQSRCKLFKNP